MIDGYTGEHLSLALHPWLDSYLDAQGQDEFKLENERHDLLLLAITKYIILVNRTSEEYKGSTEYGVPLALPSTSPAPALPIRKCVSWASSLQRPLPSRTTIDWTVTSACFPNPKPWNIKATQGDGGPNTLIGNVMEIGGSPQVQPAVSPQAENPSPKKRRKVMNGRSGPGKLRFLVLWIHSIRIMR